MRIYYADNGSLYITHNAAWSDAAGGTWTSDDNSDPAFATKIGPAGTGGMRSFYKYNSVSWAEVGGWDTIQDLFGGESSWGGGPTYGASAYSETKDNTFDKVRFTLFGELHTGDTDTQVIDRTSVTWHSRIDDAASGGSATYSLVSSSEYKWTPGANTATVNIGVITAYGAAVFGQSENIMVAGEDAYYNGLVTIETN